MIRKQIEKISPPGGIDLEQMMMSYSLMIYPFNKDYEPVVRYQKLLKNSCITGLVSPRGWGLEHTQIESGTESLRVSCNYKEALSNCSAVWFVEDSNLSLPEPLLKARLEEAIQNGKKIIYTRFRNKEELNRMEQIIPSELNITRLFMAEKNIENQIQEHKIPEQKTQEQNIQEQNIQEQNVCYDINTPVIIVLGAYPDTDKYEIQIGLRNELLNKGYQVSSVSSRQDSSILGMHPFPEFMSVNMISETDKIIRYNHYIKQIELTENPEVIIIGVPGGAIPFDKYNHNNFGILPYEISRAVNCDCGIMALPYFSLPDDNFDKISRELYDRFRISIDYFHISAITEDITQSQDSSVKSFITLDRKFIRKKIGTYGKDNVYDLTDRTTISEVTDKIIDQLSANCSDVPL
jgi:peptide maturation system protein (TIGR04066 family)